MTDTQESTPYAGQVIGNPNCRACEKANSTYSVPQRFFAYALYTLPVGNGQHFLHNASGVRQNVLGGWQSAWTVEREAGQFTSPSFSSGDPSGTGLIGGVPDRVAGVPLYPAQKTVSDWFNASAFIVPGCPTSNPFCKNPATIGRLGDSGFNIIQGPPSFDLDLSLMKYFKLWEKGRLQFRATAGDLFNHPNFTFPRVNIQATSTVATIASTVRAWGGNPMTARQITLGLRLEF
jgi:hypothetical protein